MAPGSDPAAARFAVEGAERMDVDAGGDLVLRVKGREVRLRRPAAYQEEGGLRRPVASAYRILAGGQVGFTLAEHDRGRPLVIDPVLVYSTYLAGGTSSPDFPLVDPVGDECAPLLGPGECVPDGFVAKLVDGEPVFSTYLGGSTGMSSYPGDDAVIALALDGNACLSGWTYAVDFPTVNAVQPQHGGGDEFSEIDAFAARIEMGRGGRR